MLYTIDKCLSVHDLAQIRVYSILMTIGVTSPSNSYHLPLCSELGSTLEISPSLTTSDQQSLPKWEMFP